MSKLTIIVAPDPRLKRRSEPVERVDDEVRQLMDDMLDTMHAAKGIGLAAPQVGVLKRVIVADVSPPDEAPDPIQLANPEVIWQSGESVLAEEGCLSLPDHFAEVVRSERLRIRYLDAENELRELEADGLLARCLLHEMDHLKGTLFVDHLSSLKRGMILRKLSKLKRQREAAVA